MICNFERQVPVNMAYKLAEKAVADFNLRVSATAHGVGLQTFRCRLIDDQHKKIFYGFGKGRGLQSKVSAYYEAIEHYAVYSFSQYHADNIDNYKMVHSFSNPLPCVYLTEIESGEVLLFPVFMLDPRYAKCQSHHDKNDYSKMAWRSNDSGVASGTNITEASIHALNEIVERDAHSLFLIESFIKTKNHNIRLIRKETTPGYLKDIIDKIETQYNENLMIFDITSDIGIPAIYVSMTNQPFLIQPSGCGASLNREYALERALLETLQPLHVYNEDLFNNQKHILAQLADVPLLQKAAIADTSSLRGKYEPIDFASLRDYNSVQSLHDQLNEIISKIKARGFKVFKLPIIEQKRGFSCVKFFVPGLEEFHMVQTGKHLLPNQRGMKLLGARHEKEYCFIKPES